MAVTYVELPIVALAAWRLALFITDDAGPFDLMNHIRALLRADLPLEADIPNSWQVLWSCMRCMTFWTSLACAGIWQVWRLPVELLAVWALCQLAESCRTLADGRN